MRNAIRPASVATIGVYGWDLDRFLGALASADVEQLVDVRQRRAVRGSRYAWANSLRLQHALAKAGIAYIHRKDLAPTTELRHLQYAEDARRGVGKRSRIELAPAYRDRYRREILDRADLTSLVEGIPAGGRSALLCVEANSGACHRSLIAERLAEEYDASVIELEP